MYLRNMQQRFYFDTSVFGGVFDTEFEEETLILFERVKLGKIICVYSDLTEKELLNAPKRVQSFFKQLDKQNLERIEVTPEAYLLGQSYITEKVVGPTSLDDCIHIATATINKVDVLVSWNFKHIVNIFRIRGYNSVNLRSGNGTLEIRSPKEIVGYENEE
jgi:predicted nucleic acid-binding protein